MVNQQPQSIGPFQFIGQLFHAVASSVLAMASSTNKALGIVDKGLDIAEAHTDLALARAKVSTAAELRELDAEILVIETPKKAA